MKLGQAQRPEPFKLLSSILKFFKGREVAVVLLFFGFTIVVASEVVKNKSKKKSFSESGIPFNYSFALSDTQEKSINFGDLLSKDKPSIVCLWATWCEPCVAELFELEKEKNKLGKKYEIILVNVDGSESKKVIPEVKQWLMTQKISLNTFFDFNDNLIRILGINSIPHSFAVSKDKKLLWQNSGILDWSIL